MSCGRSENAVRATGAHAVNRTGAGQRKRQAANARLQAAKGGS